MKEPKCKSCGKLGHYKSWCPTSPRTAIKQSPIKKPTYEEALAKASKAPRKPIVAKKHKLTHKPKKALKTARVKSESNSFRSTLVRRADRIFSTYIRLKDAHDDTAECITCGRNDHYKSMQNGHFISRGKMLLRYDEKNCHVQCPECNMELGGNLDKYKKFVIAKYGDSVMQYYRDVLNSNKKLSTPEIQDIIDIYTEKVKNL